MVKTGTIPVTVTVTPNLAALREAVEQLNEAARLVAPYDTERAIREWRCGRSQSPDLMCQRGLENGYHVIPGEDLSEREQMKRDEFGCGWVLVIPEKREAPGD